MTVWIAMRLASRRASAKRGPLRRLRRPLTRPSVGEKASMVDCAPILRMRILKSSHGRPGVPSHSAASWLTSPLIALDSGSV